MDRRNFIQVGGLSLLGLGITDEVLAKVRRENKPRIADRSVVLLFLGGGSTHIETFTPQPEAPVEFRSIVGHVDSVVPGIQLGGYFPQMAKIANHLNIVRSFGHTNPDHQNATHWVMTGHNSTEAQGGSPKEPSIGSIVSRYLGSSNPNTGMPTYLRANATYADQSAWLGATYNPFEANEQGLASLTPQVPLDRMGQRKIMLDAIDKRGGRLETVLGRGHSDIRNKAFDLITRDLRSVFELKNESEKIRHAYGDTFPGRSLLLARRAIEAGSRFVSINYGGWDNHSSIEKAMSQLCPPMDQAIFAFHNDLVSLGLDKDVLLVITGEFGRTPRLNNGLSTIGDPTPGRDHWGNLSTLAFMGGNYSSGRIIGEPSDKAEVPKTDPYSPMDLVATIFDHLGMPLSLSYTDNAGRPRYMIENGKVIL